MSTQAEDAWQAYRKENTIPGYDKPNREDFIFGWQAAVAALEATAREAAALEATATPASIQWGVRIVGGRTSVELVSTEAGAQSWVLETVDNPRRFQREVVSRVAAGPWRVVE